MPNFMRHSGECSDKFCILGNLTFTDKTVLITDPYNDIPENTIQLDIMKGEWESEIKLLYSHEHPAVRVEWLVLTHTDYVYSKTIVGKWKNLYKINIESGFCTITEKGFYKNDDVSEYDSKYDIDSEYMGPGDKWLWMCDKIMHRRPVAGLIPHGVFCETGMGDGEYNVSIQREAGEIIGMKIRFIHNKSMLNYLRRVELKKDIPHKKSGRKKRIIVEI